VIKNGEDSLCSLFTGKNLGKAIQLNSKIGSIISACCKKDDYFGRAPPLDLTQTRTKRIITIIIIIIIIIRSMVMT